MGRARERVMAPKALRMALRQVLRSYLLTLTEAHQQYPRAGQSRHLGQQQGVAGFALKSPLRRQRADEPRGPRDRRHALPAGKAPGGICGQDDASGTLPGSGDAS